uniref:Putative movement protein n=1 Tax=Cotton leafroll dwarf virus TaxID=312295 RepID=Q4KUQ5_9VIRU|nr:putative movement protein [Cotton leafroll dwarf virus]AEK06222.1 P4 [Cotton leafroll dwarf virus]
MEEDDHVGATGVGKISQWLWSKPLGTHNAEDDEDEEVVIGQEDAFLEDQELQARHLFSQKTVSREVPQDQSRSGRLYQIARHSAMECSRPTMNIRSQWSYWSSSPRPLQHPPVPSLTKWIHTVNCQPYPPRLTNSESPRTGGSNLRRLSSMDRNGMTPPRTSSESYIKAMVPRR